jgi:aminoglycoside phosphotransferase (APT) family kinase protein
LTCRAVLDWEQAQIGFAEADLAWWLTVDGPGSARHRGLSLTPSLPSEKATIRAYEELLGRPVYDYAYWRIFAAARISPILLKLDILCARHGFSRTNQGNNYQEKTLENLLANERL